MGWGYYIDARKNHGTPNEERRELIDWHKFDELYGSIRHIVRYEIPSGQQYVCRLEPTDNPYRANTKYLLAAHDLVLIHR